MSSLIFWKNWNPGQRFLYITSLGLLGLGLVALLFFHYRGIENTVRWEVLSELDEIPMPLDTLKLSGSAEQATVGPDTTQAQSKIILPGKGYLLKEQFVPVRSDIPEWLVFGYWGIVLAGLVLLLSAVTVLSRWWYIGVMMVFIGVLATSHLEVLQLFGSDKALGFGIAAALLGSVSYYLHAFRDDITIERRIFIFTVLVIGVCVFFSFFSKIQFVALTVTSYSLLPVVIIAIGFIGWLSIEIIAGFVYVVTHPRTGFGKNSLLNFLFITGLYLFSLLLLYFKITRQTDSSLLYLSPFVLYVVSVTVGIWSLAKRTENSLPFREAAVWLYAGLGLVTTGVMAFVLFTDNNPLIEVFEDAIIYSQLAIGTVFTGYIGLNFWPLFKQGKAVYKVIYKPMRIVQSQVWLIGGMGVVTLISLNRFHSIDQAQAGHYNGLGDLHTATQEYVIAEQYYQLALDMDFQNHKSGFSLASLALRQGDRLSAGAYFQQALHKDPTPQAYAGLSQALLNENLFFDAVFNLRKGIDQFSKSGELQNNLGYLYTRTAIADSAYYYFELARQNSINIAVPETNLLAFWGKALAAVDSANSLSALGLTKAEFKETKLLESSKISLSHEANRIALAQLTGERTQVEKVALALSSDSTLSVNNFAYLYNVDQYTQDTTLAPLLRQLINTGNNGNFYNELQLAHAYAEYNRDKISAFDILAAQTVADTSQKVALARQTLQFWLLKERTEEPAATASVASLKSESDFKEALRRHPFSIPTLQKVTAYFNQRNQPKTAYQFILNALRFRRDSPELQKMYILQCLHLRLTEFAEDGLRDLFSLTSFTDYQAFLKIYQAQRALIEKERESFR
ncbi:tetratricopeptide repeat protein [Runella sp.]|uniref:tetratricopeptide repeat protein n=1 Tax=Runella sp. TaxID=1960881 RepID=UPI003D1259D8